MHFTAVTVESVQSGKLRNVCTVSEAATVLMSEWPQDHLGPAHARARLACMAALKGNQSSKSARMAFIDAAQEADIYVGNTTWAR